MSAGRVRLDAHCEHLEVSEDLVRSVLEAVFAGEGRSLSVDVHLVDDAMSEELNVAHLGHEGPADVIAFPYPEEPGEIDPERLDGEVFVNVELAGREGASRGHGALAEALFYAAHGTLHLLGHDDATPEERAAMHALQTRYLNEAGIAIAS